LNEIELYEPLDNLEFNKIIPEGVMIFYSAKLSVLYHYKNKKRRWISHVILTDEGVIFSGVEWLDMFFPIESLCGIKNGIYYYAPWHMVSIIAGEYDFMFQAPKMISKYKLGVINDEALNKIKPYNQRKKELRERSKILIRKSKDSIYNRLQLIFKTFPKGQIPKVNSSGICMNDELYKTYRGKIINEIREEVKQGKLQYREIINPVPIDTYYDKERIFDILKSFEYLVGTYDGIKKIEEIMIAFTNFFNQNTIQDSLDVLVGIFEINSDFFANWIQEVKLNIIKVSPENEEDFFDLESLFFEKTLFKQIFKADEHIITHFKGTVKLPKTHLSYPGHIWVTNYRLFSPSLPNINLKFVTTALLLRAAIPFSRLLGGVIIAAMTSHIEKAMKQFNRILAKNPEIFFFNSPYNIKENRAGDLEFTMDIKYEVEPWKISSGNNVYKLVVLLMIEKYQGESKIDLKQRKDEICNKIRDHFSAIS